MSQIRETTTTTTSTSQDPFKSFKQWRNFLFLSEKSGDFFSVFIKIAIFISVLASIALLISITAFSAQSQFLRCPQCNNNNNNNNNNNKVGGEIQNYELFQRNLVNDHEKTNISHILFGIGGSAKTWKDRKHYNELWWKPGITRGFVWLDERPNETWPRTSIPYWVSEDTSKFKYTNSYGSRSAIRIARIILESFRLGVDNVRWFVMGDDDTVFFTENLVSVLEKYDHNQMYYIGGNSESVEQDVIHSYGMAYGGGGFAISYPLVVELVKVLDKCIDRYTYFYGSDERIRACLTEIGVPVTTEPGFHQIDVRGDPYGLVSAHPMAPLVSLHHLDYVNPLFPSKNQLNSLRSLLSSYNMDPSRILQQSFCYEPQRNWSIAVSWGYTVQLYPSFVTPNELETPQQTFVTWKTWSSGPFTFNTRHLNPEPCDRPLVYLLDHVSHVGGGRIVTTYKRHQEDSAARSSRINMKRRAKY
ncbi:hypothetical protein GIB67_012250, partial [Kingdonia uniflora]